MDKKDQLIPWTADEKPDRNSDGIDDTLEPAIPDVAAGSRALRARLRDNTSTSPELSGGDIDASWEMAESQGDEAVAGSMSTPDQNVVEEIGKAMGVTYADDEELNAGGKERARDKDRWELDPASSEDYKERLKAETE